MAMKVDLLVGETLRFNGSGSASVTLLKKDGQRIRLEVEADKTVRIVLPQRDRRFPELIDVQPADV